LATEKQIERQAANYFWEQADYWRRQGDNEYAERCERRAAEWSAL
jgi:hypothetical protein